MMSLRGCWRVVKLTEIQKKGKPYCFFPTSYAVKEFLVDFLGFPIDALVLDLTYGEGRFWYFTKFKVFGMDIRRLKWVYEPLVFVRDSLTNIWKYPYLLSQDYDLIVVDPPFSRYKHRRYFYKVIGNDDYPLELIRFAYQLARFLKKPLFVHYKEPIELGGRGADDAFTMVSYYKRCCGLVVSWFGVWFFG